MDEPTKETLLNTLEQQGLVIVGNLALWKAGYPVKLDRLEKQLEKILDAILALKKMEGIPTSLQKVDEKGEIV